MTSFARVSGYVNTRVLKKLEVKIRRAICAVDFKPPIKIPRFADFCNQFTMVIIHYTPPHHIFVKYNCDFFFGAH